MIIFENEDLKILDENDNIEFVFSKQKFDKSFKEFLKQYPELVSSTVRLGVDSIQAYKTAKNATARFYARSPFEKKVQGDIVEILKNSGKFKLVTKKFKDSGIFYELVRV